MLRYELRLTRSDVDFAARATEEKDLETKEKYVQEGIHHLRRYFGLVLYQAYLEELQLDTFEHLETFDTFVEKRPGSSFGRVKARDIRTDDAPLAVFRTFSKELKEGGLDVLAPVSRLAPADGMATTDEVMDVVTRRRGQVRSRPQPLPCEPHLTTSTRSFQILSASTILKSDFFSNLQKQSLPECVILYRRSASLRFELTSFDRPPCTQASRRRCQLPKSRGCGCLRPGSSIVEDRLRNWNAIH